MTPRANSHGGLVEGFLEALSDWLRLAAASAKVAEACRIQRNYHRAMAETLRPKNEERT